MQGVMLWNILFMAPRINPGQNTGCSRARCYVMEYIVHGSKNQNDSKLKLSLELGAHLPTDADETV